MSDEEKATADLLEAHADLKKLRSLWFPRIFHRDESRKRCKKLKSAIQMMSQMLDHRMISEARKSQMAATLFNAEWTIDKYFRWAEK